MNLVRLLRAGAPVADPARRVAHSGSAAGVPCWRWLLLLAAAVMLKADPLAWQPLPGGHRLALVQPEASTRIGFTRLEGVIVGVGFTNILSNLSVARNRVTENGSGVALGDVDGDGWCDVYLCGLERPNALFRNLGGWRFEDITVRAGVACAEQFSTGAALADVDGDGDLDLLVNGLGTGTRQFLNDGSGRFTEVTDSRLVRRFGATSLALADMDGDGDLDLFVANYRTDSFKDRPPGLKVEARLVDGRAVITPEDRFLGFVSSTETATIVEKGERDFLYLNDGGGRFLPVSWTAGAFLDEAGVALREPPLGWGLAVLFRDFNGDGAPDLYVCNDFFHWPDDFWLNDAGGRFRAAPARALRSQSMSSMAVDVADVNRDGHDDFFVVDMLGRELGRRSRQRPDMMRGVITQPLGDPAFRPEVIRNSLQLARGDGTFADVAFLAGVAATGWSWNAVFLDVDLDGWEDLLVANGNNHDVQDADAGRRVRQDRSPASPANRVRHLEWFPPLPLANLAFRNQRDLTFRETGEEWGFSAVGVSQGMACADLDRDGDLDLVLNDLNGPAALYRNDSAAPRLGVQLRGAGKNTRGIGARITVHGGPVVQSQEVIAGGRYLSSDEPARTFAAGLATNRLTVEVRWRSGLVSVVTNVPANAVLEVSEEAAVASPPPAVPVVNALFADLSARLALTHRPSSVDDFAAQPTLSRRWSTDGPGVWWADLDSDGQDELVIAGKPPTARTPAGDAWREVPGPAAAGIGGIKLPAGVSLHGPFAAGDVDGDGALDLFVGAQPLAGRYPEAPAPRFFRGQAGEFREVPAWTAALGDVGLVNDALLTDLTGDLRPELVLACEWGPLRIFRFEGGGWLPWNPPVRPPQTPDSSSQTLDAALGWWTGLASGDFDGDGRLDLVAGNWGRNTRFEEVLTNPVRLHFADFDGDGVIELLETVFDPAQGKEIVWRDYETLTRAMPFLAERAPTFAALGQTGIHELLGDRRAAVRALTVNTAETVLLLNRGDHLERRPLPIEAQFAPVFGIAVADFDGDGHEDLFLAQNFFGVELESPRYDAGRGLVLLGDGRGGFRALSAAESGIALYGEGRGAAVADFDGDARVDLAVGQQGGATQLYRNAAARPGVRVRFRGTPGNPAGLGAQLRVLNGGRPGPVREIRAGGGWRSLDSTAVVLARPTAAAELEVRHRDGRRTVHPLAPGVREVVLE